MTESTGKPAEKILYRGGEGVLVEKKSRFIGTSCPVESEAEASLFIDAMRKKYWDARHNCSALVIGGGGKLTRCSDDGEPPQTAGRPMLDVLLGERVTNICLVVTRYFGGTLLGTGGLVRAYSQAARLCLENSVVLEKKQGSRLRIETDYAGLGKIQYAAARLGVPVLDVRYAQNVTIDVLAPSDVKGGFLAQVTGRTGGRAAAADLGPAAYGILDGEVIFL